MRIPCWTSHRILKAFWRPVWNGEKRFRTQAAPCVPIFVKQTGFRRQRYTCIYPERPSTGFGKKKKKKRYPICMSLLDYPRHPISGWEYEVWSPELLPYPPFPQTLDCSQKLHWKHIHIKDSTRAKTTLPSPKGCWFTFCERSKRILKMLLLFSLLPEWWDFKTEQCLCFKDLVGSEKSRNNSQ